MLRSRRCPGRGNYRDQSRRGPHCGRAARASRRRRRRHSSPPSPAPHRATPSCGGRRPPRVGPSLGRTALSSPCRPASPVSSRPRSRDGRGRRAWARRSWAWRCSSAGALLERRTFDLLNAEAPKKRPPRRRLRSEATLSCTVASTVRAWSSDTPEDRGGKSLCRRHDRHRQLANPLLARAIYSFGRRPARTSTASIALEALFFCDRGYFFGRRPPEPIT